MYVDVVAGDADVQNLVVHTHYFGTTLHTVVWAAVKSAMYRNGWRRLKRVTPTHKPLFPGWIPLASYIHLSPTYSVVIRFGLTRGG